MDFGRHFQIEYFTAKEGYPVILPGSVDQHDCLDRWKAVEFRMFLLYIGPISLRTLLSTLAYQNFLNLFISIYIFCHPFFHSIYPDFANKLILSFLHQFQLFIW